MKETTIAIFTILFTVTLLFIGPLFFMLSWNAIAWEFNLPQFSFWQCFFISNAVRWLLGGFKSTIIKTND